MTDQAARILVVDDSSMDRRLARRLLEKSGRLEVGEASEGADALERIEALEPDLVVTDLLMPEMSGLELVEHLRSHQPMLPVVLMTAHGSEEIASEALRKGAASYVPKRNLANDLVETVAGILEIARGARREARAGVLRTRVEESFVLGHDPADLAALVAHLEEQLRHMQLFDETERMQVAVALREALVNAVYHGNLEVPSEAREVSQAYFEEQAQTRKTQEPYRSRRVRIEACHDRASLAYVVADDGAGFDPDALPDPLDPANLERVHGRGLLLIRTFMDEVQHNEKGNAITMIKRADEDGESGSRLPRR